jgi:hypothetical protein
MLSKAARRLGGSTGSVTMPCTGKEEVAQSRPGSILPVLSRAVLVAYRVDATVLVAVGWFLEFKAIDSIIAHDTIIGMYNILSNQIDQNGEHLDLYTVSEHDKNSNERRG